MLTIRLSPSFQRALFGETSNFGLNTAGLCSSLLITVLRAFFPFILKWPSFLFILSRFLFSLVTLGKSSCNSHNPWAILHLPRLQVSPLASKWSLSQYHISLFQTLSHDVVHSMALTSLLLGETEQAKGQELAKCWLGSFPLTSHLVCCCPNLLTTNASHL